MKLKKNHLPNLFDQYDTEENRVTNALFQTLAISSKIAERFINTFIAGISTRNINSLELSEQGLPKKNSTDAIDFKKTNESVPDGWFILRDRNNNVSDIIVVESKIIKSSAKKRQLLRHLAKARRRFQPEKEVFALLITPDDSDPFPLWRPDKGSYQWTNWRKIHAFAKKEKKFNKDLTAQIIIKSFMEFIEMKELAGFQGIDFSEGYNNEKAKRILRTLMQDIKDAVLKSYPNLKKQKGNILDPWDVFASEDLKTFTKGIHFTLSVKEKSLEVLITVPNKCLRGWTRIKEVMSTEQKEFESILSALRQKLPNLILLFQQRHFIAQRFAFFDGLIQVDIDTTDLRIESRVNTKVKKNSQLFEYFVAAVRDAPRSINREVNFITKYYYNDPKYKHVIKQAEFSKTVISAINSFKPLYDFLTN